MECETEYRTVHLNANTVNLNLNTDGMRNRKQIENFNSLSLRVID